MSRCPYCDCPLLSDERVCRSCAATEASDELAADAQPADGLDGRVAVARFRNGAEAGFFADELTRTTGIVPEVLARERFDGVHATWSLDYVLLVDAAQAPAAAASLQALVEADADEYEQPDPEPAGEIPGGVWMPLVLTLAAGSIACFGIERAEKPPRPAALVLRDPREPPDLWHVLAAGRGAWRQKLEVGPGERTLAVDPEARTAVLTEDHDGDGAPEREWRFDWGAK